MKQFDKRSKTLTEQFENINWIENSGVSPEELKEMYSHIMSECENQPKNIIKAKVFDMVLRNSRIAIDKEDIFQD